MITVAASATKASGNPTAQTETPRWLRVLQTSTKAPENPTAPAEVPRWLRVLQKQPLETNQEHTIFEHQKNKTKKHSHAPTMFM